MYICLYTMSSWHTNSYKNTSIKLIFDGNADLSLADIYYPINCWLWGCLSTNKPRKNHSLISVYLGAISHVLNCNSIVPIPGAILWGKDVPFSFQQVKNKGDSTHIGCYSNSVSIQNIFRKKDWLFFSIIK